MQLGPVPITFVFILHVQACLSITPYFLWGVINATLLERRIPKYCTRLIFHNNSTLAESEEAGNFTGLVGNAFVDINAALTSVNGSDFPSDWEDAEQDLESGLKVLIEEKVDPCLMVASFVFDSGQYDDYLNNATNKRRLRHHLSDLLQFFTPIRNRHLFILRIAEAFNTCPKGPRYPTRLVPQWELILFDFFHEARAIQGPFHEEDEPYLRVTKETGKWRWLCEDIIRHLELEKICQSNKTCLMESELFGQWDLSTQPCKWGFRPRQ